MDVKIKDLPGLILVRDLLRLGKLQNQLTQEIQNSVSLTTGNVQVTQEKVKH